LQSSADRSGRLCVDAGLPQLLSTVRQLLVADSWRRRANDTVAIVGRIDSPGGRSDLRARSDEFPLQRRAHRGRTFEHAARSVRPNRVKFGNVAIEIERIERNVQVVLALPQS